MSFKTLNFSKEFCEISMNYFCAAALPTVDKLPVHTSTSYPPHLGPQLQNKYRFILYNIVYTCTLYTHVDVLCYICNKTIHFLITFDLQEIKH